jgi:hypothetical protein
VILVPLALILGAALGLTLRNHGRAVTAVALVTPLLSVAALVVQFIPGGAEECTSTLDGSMVCHVVAAVSGWSGPLPYAIAGCLVLLACAPLVSARTGAWPVSAVSAALQAVPQVISFGGFVAWGPALLATVAVTFAIAWSRHRRSTVYLPDTEGPRPAP